MGVWRFVVVGLASTAEAGLFIRNRGSSDTSSQGSEEISVDISPGGRRLTSEEAQGRQLRGAPLYYRSSSRGYYTTSTARIEGSCCVTYSGSARQTSTNTGLTASISLGGNDVAAFTFNFKKPLDETDDTVFEKVNFDIDTSKLPADYQVTLNLQAALDRAVREGAEQLFTVYCETTQFDDYDYPVTETASGLLNLTRSSCEPCTKKYSMY